jgi:hypothetical protein
VGRSMTRFPAMCALAALLMAGAGLGTGVHAAADITGPEARAFLGGRTGKIAYLKNQLKQVYFIDLGDSVLVERKVADDAYCWSPMIHPDGSRIVYESNAAIYIRPLAENAKERHLIYSGTPRNNHSLEPHWWIHPKTGDEYIIFTTGDASDVEWPPQSGETYIQKVVNNEPSGPLQTLLPFMMASGRSKNGVWGGTSHHSTGMYKLHPDSVTKAFREEKNWIDSGGWGACNGSMNPTSDPARQNRIMHLNSYLELPGGETFENHKAIVIRSWDDKDLNSPIWAMGIPGVRCNDDKSGNLFWDHCEWSSDEGYFTAVGSKVIENWTDGDIYIGRIDYGGNNQIRRVLAGGGINHYPHLWIKDGVAPARIRLDKSALEFVSLKRDSAGPAADTVRASNAGDGTLPVLKTDSLPAWIKIAFAGNGTNAVRIIVTVDRAVAGLGDHSARVKVSYGQAADTASFGVRLRYSDPVPSSIKAGRRKVVMHAGDVDTLRATVLDQTGAPVSPQPAIAWSALDAMPVSADGKITGDTAAWTSYAFKAVSGSFACTTTVFIAKRILRIDAGAAADSVPAGWASDSGFPSAWPRETSQGPVDLQGTVDPAPDRLYRTVRRPQGSLVFGDFKNGRYALRFHFASPFPGHPSPASGLDVKLEGVTLLEGYRPPARPDSGLKGDVRELLATVSDGDGLEIGFSGTSDAAALAGLEIYDLGPLAIGLLHPDGGETFHVGDTLHARWETDGFITSVGIQVSIDSGLTWIPVTRRSAVNLGQPDWGDYPWVIPDSLDGKSLVTGRAILSVYDYFGTDRDRSNQVFSIQPNQVGIRARAARGASGTLAAGFSAGRLSLNLPRTGSYRIALVDMRNRAVLSARATGPGPVSLPAAGLPRGVYRLLIAGPGENLTRSLTVLE